MLNLRGVSGALAVVLYSARLTGAKDRARISGLPVNGRRCQESTTWAGSAPVRTSRTGEYEQPSCSSVERAPRELKVCWASMLSRSVKMPLNLTDQHAQSDGGKSETPSAGDDEPLWRADFLRCEASFHNPTHLRDVPCRSQLRLQQVRPPRTDTNRSREP
jgi:hypothetical protein